MTCPARFLLLSALVGATAGCFIEQPGTQDPAYPQSPSTGAQQTGAPSTATASVVSGDGTLDPGALANAVSSAGGALGRCFVGSGQVDMVVTLDTSGRAMAVRGLGEGSGSSSIGAPLLGSSPMPICFELVIDQAIV